MVSTWLRGLFFGAGAQAGGKIAQFNQHRRERLAYFIVQFARECAPLGFLRLNQTRGEVFELAAGFGDFHVLRVRLIFQPKNLAHAESGHAQAQRQRGYQRHSERGFRNSAAGRPLDRWRRSTAAH